MAQNTEVDPIEKLRYEFSKHLERMSPARDAQQFVQDDPIQLRLLGLTQDDPP